MVNLQAGFAKFSDHWSPRVAGQVNDMQVKLVKLEGEFDWHHHESEDELFWVTKGTMVMQFRDRDVRVGPSEFIIVPAKVEHCPLVPEGEVECVLFEPATTLNTGNMETSKTVHNLKEI